MRSLLGGEHTRAPAQEEGSGLSPYMVVKGHRTRSSTGEPIGEVVI